MKTGAPEGALRTATITFRKGDRDIPTVWRNKCNFHKPPERLNPVAANQRHGSSYGAGQKCTSRPILAQL